MASSTPPPLVAKVTSDSTVTEVTNDSPRSAQSSPVARTTKSPTSTTAIETPKQSLVAQEAGSMTPESNTVAIELTSSEDEGEAGAKNSESDSGA